MTKRIVSNRFSELLAIKARREARKSISRREVMQATGLSKITIDNYANNEVTRFDAHVVMALCEYFGCTPGELLVIEEREEPSLMRLDYSEEDTPVVPMRALG